MKKSERLLGQFTVADLTKFFNTKGQDPRVLAVLHEELRYRKPAAMERLRTAVSSRMGAGAAYDAGARTAPPPAAPDSVIVACTRCTTRLRFNRERTAIVATCPKCSQDYGVNWQGAACLIQPHSIVFTQHSTPRALTLTQAYAVVGATSHEKWDPEIKRKCRSLLQQYHPDKCSSAPVAVQKLAETEFKRVNEAYRLLEQAHSR